MPVDSRHDARDEPTRDAHFNDCNQRVILFESDEGSAEIIWL
jgi:hypothetical protein